MYKSFQVVSAAALLIVGGLTPATALDATSPFPVSNDNIPTGHTGSVFVPSFAFPATNPETGPYPWERKSFRTDPKAYLAAVLGYVFEGMDTTTWRVDLNPSRKWYHVPWMHLGSKGREFMHGLTRERSSPKGELGSGQKRCVQNWAVGFYNPAGGVTLGEIWGDGTQPPVPAKARFPVGTVVAKLLFTHATETEVPMLAGAPRWQANVHDPAKLDTRGCPEEIDRVAAEVRLLQLDVAVRDKDANSTTGWVFGTFVYNGALSGSDPWAKLEPVGLMWGNDPDLSDADVLSGKKPEQGIVLSNLGFGREFGRGGRMNGPVDNSRSACLSCHMTAQYPTLFSEMAPPAALTDWNLVKCWFRNLKPEETFGHAPVQGQPCGGTVAGLVSTDYSLQLAIALRNYRSQHPIPTIAFETAPAATDLARGETSKSSNQTFDVRFPFEIDGVQSFPIDRSGE